MTDMLDRALVTETVPVERDVLIELDQLVVDYLEPERIVNVLRAKLEVGRNLDTLTRGDRLDYFWLYSSVTTLIGNPGQAAYVAGNAALEALARRRRAAGRPALAVRFGAIADVASWRASPTRSPC